MNELNMPIEEMEGILEEIWGTLRVETLDATFGRTTPAVEDLFKLDQRLQRILQGVHSYQSEELSCWLRYTYTWSALLPTWQPLFQAAYATMKSRHPAQIVEGDLLYGLFPRP